MSFFETEALTKKFGKLTAVNAVNFTVKEKELVGIIGPNGAGKTTLFNIMTGFDAPTSGFVTFKSNKITSHPPHKIVRKGLSRTFQVPRPFKELNLFDNVDVANPLTTKLNLLKSNDHTEDILRQVGLWNMQNQWAGNLSQGDLRRLEIARALATHPDLLLLDEPFAGLNSSEIEVFLDLFKELNEQGLTIIIIEHKLKELMRMVERVMVLNYGEMIADDTPQNIGKNEEVLKAYLGDRRWDFA